MPADGFRYGMSVADFIVHVTAPVEALSEMQTQVTDTYTCVFTAGAPGLQCLHPREARDHGAGIQGNTVRQGRLLRGVSRLVSIRFVQHRK